MAARPFVGYHAPSEQFAPTELVELAVAAERAGFDGLSISDHFHPWQENQGHAGHAWVTLAAIGARTERLEFGTSVTCPIYRYHPAQVAHAFATLAALYPGRVYLGVGTGEALNEAVIGDWGPHRERAARLAEAIRLIRELWSGEPVDFDGRYYQVRGAQLYDPPRPPPPIYVAASGPRSARLAGREGDGWITDAGTVRQRPELREAFLQAAREAGKDAARLPVSVELWVVVGDELEALAGARLWQFIPIFGEVVDVSGPRQIQQLAEERSSPERAMEGWLVSEDPVEHIAAIEALAALGVTRVFIHSPQNDQQRVIDFYGEQVLPALRAKGDG
ncbi:MAG: TIGR03557 family F420-dependent LLM class oxidoreductase [Chloroflexi bacterium]|nr:TIGR03557 family F420-dependent LLM class oxidoreductase [Chloroflexota bacterium]